MGTITIIIICIGALILGAALSWVVSEKLLGQKTRAILSEAEREAEVLKQKKLLEVKEKFLQLKGPTSSSRWHSAIISSSRSRAD